MTWEERVLTTRVRVLALKARARAGGRLTAADWRRALQPIAGDLLELSRRPLGGTDSQAENDCDPGARRSGASCFYVGKHRVLRVW